MAWSFKLVAGAIVCLLAASCSPTLSRSHLCAFNGASPGNDSGLSLTVLGVTLTPFSLSGAIEVACDQPGSSGKRPCNCLLRAWDPAVMTGVGVFCADPVAGCPAGEIDCDGGNTLGVDLVADHEIARSCSDHDDCAVQCDTYCSGLAKGRFVPGCEGLCQGGANDGLRCECDDLSSPSCAPNSIGDCPNGKCVGLDNETLATGDLGCQCQCLDTKAGGPSVAGALSCTLGFQLRVEVGPPCDHLGVLFEFPPLCSPATTETFGTNVLNLNEGPPWGFGPVTTTGNAIACGTLDSSVTAGLELVSNPVFFDTTIGDLITGMKFECE